jgi:hypothetical protein
MLCRKPESTFIIHTLLRSQKSNVCHTLIGPWQILVSMPRYDEATRKPSRHSLPTE